jgi:hypothetical protein
MAVVELDRASWVALEAVAGRIVIPTGVAIVRAMSVVGAVSIERLPKVRISLGRVRVGPGVAAPSPIGGSGDGSSRADGGNRADCGGTCDACTIPVSVRCAPMMTTGNTRNTHWGQRIADPSLSALN